ncbi:helix-turn-helix domain-containing protein [Agrobacterium larrymoorei]|uniref:helix-turn-helix domain-containing protein n=1 Tax=Agrobacterium larrymoorei TaxID=160699 RepID=UPI001572393D|nr:AraC family transcriptional regulator [Agrobacterium larrymoorei]NTJ44568.1 helix-turn-helix domain-containing protein [Agrobacterium larrymoorei]
MTNSPYKELKISSRDIGEVEEYLSEAYAPVSATPIGSHYKYGVHGHLAVLDDVFFEWSETIGSYRVTPVAMFDSVLFNFVSKGAAGYQFKGNKLSVTADQVIGYRHADNVDVFDGSVHSTVVMSDALLCKRMSILLDKPVVQSVEFSKSALDQGNLKGLAALVQFFNGSPLQDIARSLNAHSPAVGNLVIDSFLLNYPNNYTQKLKAPLPLVAPRQVRRAIEYIHAHPAARSSPEHLASLSDVSVRSLQYSFLLCVGQTISQYQLALRLEKARNEIEQSKDLSAKEIAEKWGFASQSTFSQSFKKAFGATPSQIRKGGV